MKPLDLLMCYPLRALALFACQLSAAHAAVAWNEVGQGDLSSAHDKPTFVALALGSNDVLGSVGMANDVIERDFFTITVPSGRVLSAIYLLGNTALLSDTDQAPVAVYSGTMAASPAAPYLGLLGYALVQNRDIGRDLLPIMGASGTPPFAVPLAAGSYTFLVQDGGLGTADYGLRLTVGSVPEPATAGLLLAGLALLGGFAHRRAIQGKRPA